MKFSVLMSIYARTTALELSACLDSIYGQTCPPSELVLVFDGPVDEACRHVAQDFSARDIFPLTVVELARNAGLGIALNEGLKSCNYDLVARMDSDDICVTNRFELQCNYLEENPEVSVLGGALLEKYVYKNRLFHAIRTVPLDSESVVKVARLRNPMNHPTVMFKKGDVEAAGGYLPFLLLEDYYLWARMLLKGNLFANLPMVLVEAGADTGYFERRGGWDYFQRERALAKEFRSIGFQSRWTTLRFLGPRWLFRMMPVALRARLYPMLLRHSGQNLKSISGGR